MAEDNAKLQRAQEVRSHSAAIFLITSAIHHFISILSQRLLEAMEHAASALDNLEAGNAGQAQDTCSRFLEAVEVRKIPPLSNSA